MMKKKGKERGARKPDLNFMCGRRSAFSDEKLKNFKACVVQGPVLPPQLHDKALRQQRDSVWHLIVDRSPCLKEVVSYITFAA